MLFGTHYEFRGNSTQFEYEVSETMEGKTVIEHVNWPS